MRIVRRIDETLFDVLRAQQVDDVLLFGRDLERLRCDPHVPGEVLAGQTLQPGHLAAQPLVLGVKPPQQTGYPGRSALDQDDSKARVFLKNAMCDEADEMGLDRLRPHDMRLEVRADASTAGAGWIRPAAGAAVNGNRPSRLLRGRIAGREDGVASHSCQWDDDE